MIDKLKQWIYVEICERRDYSASKAYEMVIDKIEELQANEAKPSNESVVCVKCGKKYMPRLFKTMTICEECFEKL